jgi:hypothetical protein
LRTAPAALQIFGALQTGRHSASSASKSRSKGLQGQDLDPHGRFGSAICFQKAPGQDLAKNGRFPMIPEENFHRHPRGRQMAEIGVQKAPCQDLAKNGRFPMIPNEKFNGRPRLR